MIKKSAFAIGIIGLMLNSCIEHEVIPAPTPEVDLNCSFEGNGVPYTTADGEGAGGGGGVLPDVALVAWGGGYLLQPSVDGLI